MPVLKEYENPAEKMQRTTLELIAVKQVAEGKMSHPTLTQEKAKKIYEKYGDAIDKMIEIGSVYLRGGQNAPKYMEMSSLESGFTKFAGKSLSVLGSIGAALSLGYLGEGFKGVKEAWSAGDEMVAEKQKAINQYNAALKEFKYNFASLSQSYEAVAKDIMADNEGKLASATNNLASAIKATAKSLQDIQISTERVGLTSEAIAGALDVYKEFLMEVGVTVAMMGATEVGLKALKTGVQYIGKTEAFHQAISSITKGAVGVGRTAKFAEIGSKVGNIAHKFEKPFEFVKGAYKGQHAAGDLEQNLKENDKHKQIAYTSVSNY